MGRGAYKKVGGKWRFTPTKKKGGGGYQVLAMLNGGGRAEKVLGYFFCGSLNFKSI